MVREAEEIAEQDRKRKEEVELQNTAESMLYTADKTKSASDELSRALQKIGAEIYEKVASKPGEEKAQQAPPPPGAQASGEGDKVVDAEYREVKDEGSR